MKLFVWDFHGVLEKGNEGAVLEISNEVLKQFGYPQKFTLEEIHKLYGLKWFEFFKYLLPSESHEKHLQLRDSCLEYQKFTKVTAKYIKPNDYAYKVLEEITKTHYQIVISNSTPEYLKHFLDTVNLTHFFSNGNAFATTHKFYDDKKTKQVILEDFLNGKSFDDIIVIGDSPEDISLVSVAGGISYLYAHPGRSFKECNPDYRINDLRNVLKEI